MDVGSRHEPAHSRWAKHVRSALAFWDIRLLSNSEGVALRVRFVGRPFGKQ